MRERVCASTNVGQAAMKKRRLPFWKNKGLKILVTQIFAAGAARLT